MCDVCIVFWDVDATLLNFEVSEGISLRECLKSYGVDITDAELSVYRKINRSYWERFERKEIVKQHVYMGRFVDFFALLGVKHISIIDFNAAYQLAIGRNFVPEDGALEACEELRRQGCRQYVVSNGSGVAQHAKLRGSGLDEYMEDIFISEEMGTEKPDPHFFELCAQRIKNYDKKRTVIIGDSLTSDMQGGNNAGIRCCWFNPKGLPAPAQLRIDYDIRSLREIPAVLK